MASCRTCGDDLADNARFCSECGTPVGETVELFGAADTSSSEVSVRTSGWRTRVYGLVAVAAVGLLGWLMLSAPSQDDGSLSELAQGSSDEDEDETEDEADPARPNGGATTSWTGTTTWRSTTEAEEVGGGPVLGEPVGLSVYFGSDNGKLRRVDLDTGDIDEFEIRAMPLYAEGDWLVLWRSNGMSLEIVDVDDPEGESRTLGQAAFFGQSTSVTAGPEPGQLWARGPSWEEPEWHLFDLASGEVLRTVPGVLSYFGPVSGGPTVSSSPGGGVFELRGEDYVEVADGQLMASSDEFALVKTCADPVSCQLGWLSRDGWEPVERPTPPEEVHAGWLSPDGRVLSYYGPQGPRVFDVATGTYLTGFEHQVEGLAVAPDGHWLASYGSRLQLRSLDTGQDFELDGVVGPGWGSAVFVQNR